MAKFKHSDITKQSEESIRKSGFVPSSEVIAELRDHMNDYLVGKLAERLILTDNGSFLKNGASQYLKFDKPE